MEVVDLVRRLHRTPPDWPTVPLIPTRSIELGSYAFGRTSGAVFGIEFNDRGTRQADTILHEVGHLLDHQYIGMRGVWASDPVLHSSLIQWNQAIHASSYWWQLEDILRRPLESNQFGEIDELDLRRLSYLLHPKELFARSYLQWAALRGPSDRALIEVRRAADWQPPFGDFPEQWTDEDFETIGMALDELFARLNRSYL